MMDKNRQIEDMANIIAFKAFEQSHLENGDDNLADIVAIELYDNGYRKASDVAREIFAEIEEQLRRLADESKILRDKEINLGEKTQLNGEWIGVRLALRDISELKKKYIQSEDTE